MAQTYDLTSSSPIPAATDLRTGDIINCPYSGTYKTITLPKGTYKLECWGAQGGSYNTTYIGGKGGYSYGTLTLTEDTILYLYAGGQGQAASSSATGNLTGGFNGGGKSSANTSYYACSGGGGSDIRIGQNSLYARVIVAGGGGGAQYSISYKCNGGHGGGAAGIAGGQTNTTYPGGQPGNTVAAGASYYGKTSNSTAYGTLASFGQGGSAGSSYAQIAGGGGGWYGGGYARRAAGGGGSGYVYTSSTASHYPSGVVLNSSYYLTDAFTVAGNTSFTDYSGSTVTGHEGDGAIRITALSIRDSLFLIKTNSSTWSEISKVFMKVSDSEWASIDIGG